MPIKKLLQSEIAYDRFVFTSEPGYKASAAEMADQAYTNKPYLNSVDRHDTTDAEQVLTWRVDALEKRTQQLEAILRNMYSVLDKGLRFVENPNYTDPVPDSIKDLAKELDEAENKLKSCSRRLTRLEMECPPQLRDNEDDEEKESPAG